MIKKRVPVIILLAAIISGILAVKFLKKSAKPIKGGKMQLSSVFKNNDKIPSKYTCDGENISPELTISDIPAQTKSLVLIVDDPDAPMGNFTHWILYNIPADTKEISSESIQMLIDKGAQHGINDFGKTSYGGPCPPFGVHRYFFKLYAIDRVLEVKPKVTKSELQNMIRPHILEKTELIGVYSRK